MSDDRSFKDLFSTQSGDYSKFRPRYPAALYDFLSSLCSSRRIAWDCGTGNGQAALELATRFTQVIATDPSEKQIAQAQKNPKIEYRVARAEDSGIAAGSVDLITVAQALHWFDLKMFYAEVRRVSRTPGAWLAVWTYSLALIDPRVDEVVETFYRDGIGRFWEPERRLVEDGYRSIDFPFAELEPPSFEMEQDWDLSQLLGYLGTWSAVQAATKALGKNPVEELTPKLARAWGDPHSVKKIRWPLNLRVGRVG